MKDLVIKKVSDFNISWCHALHSEVFGEEDSTQVPSHIYIVHKGKKYVGYVSVYMHNIDCVYIQYAGVVDEFKGYLAPIIFKKVVEYIHEEYKGIIFRIKNINIKAIKVALNAGFLIIGTRFDGGLFVELMKVREEK